MKIIDILKKCEYTKIESKIKLHYGSKELNNYKKLYFELCNKKIDTSVESDTYIYITAYKGNEDGEDTMVNIFNENDVSLYFDVSAYEVNNDMIYSIASSCYSNFLQYNIDNETLKNFSYESILAHCFNEITCYGFEDNLDS